LRVLLDGLRVFEGKFTWVALHVTSLAIWFGKMKPLHDLLMPKFIFGSRNPE